MTNYAELLNLVNHDAETTVLGAMRDNTSLAVTLAEQLESTDFYDVRRQVVFDSIVSLLRGIEPVDVPAIVAESHRVAQDRKLKDVAVTQSFIESLPAGKGDVVNYAHTLKKLSWLRGISSFAEWLVKALQANPKPDELFSEASERLQKFQPKTENGRFVYGWLTQDKHDQIIRQRIEEFKAGIKYPYDWPWAAWNTIIRPLRPGMLGILAAPDGQGKTTYLEMVAEHWASRSKHVVYVHLEDEETYKYDRRLARHALVDMEHIEDGNLSREELQKIQHGKEKISSFTEFLHYYDGAGESMQSIIRELESRVREGVCDAVVFDYLDKVQPTRAQAKLFGENMWDRQANDMEQLKTFAERSRLPILTATQGNKSMQSGGMQTRQNIQGSGQKSQKSQLVIILTRDIVGEGGLFDKNGIELAKHGEYSPIVNVRIDKQNRGRTGGFRQFIVGKYFAVRDLDMQRTDLNDY